MKDEPAFPTATGYVGHLDGGLTKRELFAAMAMHSAASLSYFDVNNRPDLIAEAAVGLADALIAELEKSNVR